MVAATGSALLATGAKMAGRYLLAKGLAHGKKYLKKKIAGAKFSKDASAKGAVNMVKRGMTRPGKGTSIAAYNHKDLANAKSGAAANTVGGVEYATKKLLHHSNALSYGKFAATTKTRL